MFLYPNTGHTLHRLDVCLDKSMTETKYQPPKERFVEYGPEDAWLAVYGIGRMVEVPSPAIYRIGKKLVMHPATWDRIKKVILEAKNP